MGYKLKRIMMRVNTLRLPSEYQEVEYIESSGTQYLAPGVSHSAGDTIKVEADIYIKGNGAIYSQYTGWTPVFDLWQLGIDNGAFFARMNANSGGLSTTWTPSTYTVNTRYNVVAEGQTSINQKAPYLLANNDANGVGWYMSAKLYSFKIWKNGTLVRDLVPCYRKADTEIGMYDLVNDVFYTNQGSGTFTKGNNMPDMVEKQARPSGGWQPGANCVAYYPLENDFNDYSGNGYNLTNSGIVLGVSADGYKGAYLESGHYAYTTGFNLPYSGNRTIAFWTGCQTLVEGSWSVAITFSFYPYMNVSDGIGYTTYDYSTWGLGNLRGQEMGKWSSMPPIDIGSIVDANNMHSYVITIDVDNSQFKFYKDGVLFSSLTVDSQNLRSSGFTVGNNQSSDPERNANGYVRQVVIDNSVWSAQDALDYHNGTA